MRVPVQTIRVSQSNHSRTTQLTCMIRKSGNRMLATNYSVRGRDAPYDQVGGVKVKTENTRQETEHGASWEATLV